MENLKPRRGAIALCSMGRLGMITSDEPTLVTYFDGKTGIAWTGIHIIESEATGLDSKPFTINRGSPWTSRNPKVMCYIEDLLPFIPNTRKAE